MKKPQIIIGIIVLVIILGVAGWYAYSNPQIASALGLRHAPVAQNGMNQRMASSTERFAGMRGGFVTGSIEVLSDNGFTVTLTDGTTKNITLTATTTIQNYAAASSTPTTITSDQLSVGEQVSVIGSAQSDGSVVARTVRTGVLPTPGEGGFGRGPGNGGRPTPPTATN